MQSIPSSHTSSLKLMLNAHTVRSLFKASKLINRKQQIAKKLLKTDAPAEIALLKQCSSKKVFKQTLNALSPRWRRMLKYYVKHCFVYDIFNRKIACKLQLLSKQRTFYAVIDKPYMLDYDCHFDNNLVKNFCSGLANYAKNNHAKLMQATAKLHWENTDENVYSSTDNTNTDQHTENQAIEELF